MSLFTPEPVTVIRRTVERDELNDEVAVTVEREDVTNVLVTPGTTTDLDASRPEGVTVALTLHFPKTYTKALKGCLVEVRGATYAIVGDPQPYTPENTPGEWNRPAEVTRTDG